MSVAYPSLKNDRFLRALKRQPHDRTPIWIMRQAGRYLPEYRATRAGAGDFMSLCKAPELACEVTLQPLSRYQLDAAILFSDILTIPDAMGLGLYFAEGEGPKFKSPIQGDKAVENLSTDVISDLGYVFDAVSVIRRELDGRVPLIGFAGSPWTLATYMLEGKSTRDFVVAKHWLYNNPKSLHTLLGKLADVTTQYLIEQVRAGAQALQVFDTWGGILSDNAYVEFSLQYMRKIVEGIKANPESADIPVILFTKGGGNWLNQIADAGCSALGLDWSVNIGNARQQLNDRVALQGNMDPAVLRAEPEAIDKEVQRILASYGKHNASSGHVFNLGHGITPDIDPENVQVLVESVIKYSAQYH